MPQQPLQPLSGTAITAYLAELASWFSIQVNQEVDSTNTMARQLAQHNAPEGTVVIAARQRQGRGRFGRMFYSPADTGIYMSLLLRPSFSIQQALYITTAAAVATAQAIEAVANIPARIKWVNDIYCRDKKVCGILTESAVAPSGDGLAYAILGIGINVYPPKDGFPDEFAHRAGAVLESADRLPDIRNHLAAEILRRFYQQYQRLPTPCFLEEYRQRSLLVGRQVQVQRVEGAHAWSATVLDITDTLSLRVRLSDGTEQELSSGDVTLTL